MTTTTTKMMMATIVMKATRTTVQAIEQKWNRNQIEVGQRQTNPPIQKIQDAYHIAHVSVAKILPSNIFATSKNVVNDILVICNRPLIFILVFGFCVNVTVCLKPCVERCKVAISFTFHHFCTLFADFISLLFFWRCRRMLLLLLLPFLCLSLPQNVFRCFVVFVKPFCLFTFILMLRICTDRASNDLQLNCIFQPNELIMHCAFHRIELSRVEFGVSVDSILITCNARLYHNCKIV